MYHSRKPAVFCLSFIRKASFRPGYDDQSWQMGFKMVHIRKATVADVPMLAKLRFALRSPTGPVCDPEKEFLERCGQWMEQRLRMDGPWHCWVATIDDIIVGNLWTQVVEKIPNPSQKPECHAYLTNFYVTEEARGCGIGSRLLTAALGWCKTARVDAAFLWPTERSRSLYQRYGFAVRDDLLELIVEKP